MPDQLHAPSNQLTKQCDCVELIMPAREDMLTLTRLTAAGLLAHVSRDFDMQEDVKSAAAESCYCLMQQPCAYARIKLCFSMHSDEITLNVSGLDPAVSVPNADQENRCVDVALCILESMVDSVNISLNDGVIDGFTLKKHIA